jgi:hypothetical protein
VAQAERPDSVERGLPSRLERHGLALADFLDGDERHLREHVAVLSLVQEFLGRADLGEHDARLGGRHFEVVGVPSRDRAVDGRRVARRSTARPI